MNPQVNATVTVLTASTVDDYTGERAEQPSATGVPAAIVERSRTVMDPVTGSPRVVRQVMVKLPPHIAVTNADRLRDEDGVEYAVREVHQYRSGGRRTDKVCEVVRLDNAQP